MTRTWRSAVVGCLIFVAACESGAAGQESGTSTPGPAVSTTEPGMSTAMDTSAAVTDTGTTTTVAGTAATVAGTTTTEPTLSTLDCGAIGDVAPSSDYLIVLKALALPDPGRIPALQASGQGGSGTSPFDYFAKSGLGVRVGAQWRISVSAGSRDHLRIGWSSPATPSIAVGPGDCATLPRSETGWLWYPGGYWVDRPGCYAVDVEVDGRTQRVPVAIGAQCPGHQPG